VSAGGTHGCIYRNQKGPGHLAGQHLDLYEEPVVYIELDSVDRGALKSGDLKG